MQNLGDITFQLGSYLGGLPGFRGLECDPGPPVLAGSVEEWAREHLPLRLPTDLAGFLETNDGLSLRWRAVCLQGDIVVGYIGVSSLAGIVRLEDAPPRTAETPGHFVAYVLHRNPKIGDAALVYDVDSNDSGNPTVWFRDRGGGWHFVAANFTCFFRLMLVHLGILGWELAYTPQGLMPLTVQWMRLYCPERLMFDGIHRPQLDQRAQP